MGGHLLVGAATTATSRITRKPSSAKEIGKACIESIWALMFPILLIVFIRFGVMTPSESGAFAVFYALFVGVFIYKELNLERFKECLVSSVKDLSVTTMILAFSGIFSYGVVFDQLPATLTNILITVTSNKYLLILLIILMQGNVGGATLKDNLAVPIVLMAISVLAAILIVQRWRRRRDVIYQEFQY